MKIVILTGSYNLHGTSNTLVDEFIKGAKENINRVIELTGLTIESRKKTGQLSKGYKQRVGLAAALIHQPEVLILDEPTSGLDPNQIIEIRNVIKEEARNKTKHHMNLQEYHTKLLSLRFQARKGKNEWKNGSIAILNLNSQVKVP